MDELKRGEKTAKASPKHNVCAWGSKLQQSFWQISDDAQTNGASANNLQKKRFYGDVVSKITDH